MSAPYGLRLVGAVREGKAGVFREFNGEKTARLKRSELGEGEAGLIAVDAEREPDGDQAALGFLSGIVSSTATDAVEETTPFRES